MRSMRVILLLILSLNFLNGLVGAAEPTETCKASDGGSCTPDKPEKPRVCINMIAKDEAQDLQATMDGARPHISGYFICDTGSTDGTQEMAINYFAEAGIPGMLVNHTWKNFAHNRNLCLNEGAKLLSDKCDFWLLVDADQAFQSADGSVLTDVVTLDKDAYSIEERSDGVVFYMTRLVRIGLPWKYFGATHEYISLAKSVPGVEYSSLPANFYTIHDSNMGRGGRLQKFERDLQLLLEDLEEDPNNHRSHFYIANTYRALDQPDKAIQHWLTRIQMDGWREEMYVSAIEIGSMLERLVNANGTIEQKTHDKLKLVMGKSEMPPTMDVVVNVFKAAAALLNYRKEAHYNLARLYRTHYNDQTSCFRHAIDAHRAGPHNAETLFTDTRLVNYMVDDELCVCAYYVEGHEMDGLEGCERLEKKLESEDFDEDDWRTGLLQRTRENKDWYIKKQIAKGPAFDQLPATLPETVKILFHSMQLSNRGTEVAIFDYGLWLQTFYNVEAHFVFPYPGWVTINEQALKKFMTTFPGRIHLVKEELFANEKYKIALDKIITDNGIDILYKIQQQVSLYEVSAKVPTLIHEVFACKYGLGTKNMAISPFVMTELGSACADYVPHTIWMPDCGKDNMRKELGIPDKAFVFGWIGGHDAWDSNATPLIRHTAESRGKDVFFLLQNPPPPDALELQDLSNVAFIDSNSSQYQKCRIVQTSDVFLHTRPLGETFGLAVAEFSLGGKSIITHANSPHRYHIEVLGEDAYTYTSYEELLNFMMSLDKKTIKNGDHLAKKYQKYAPAHVMEMFNDKFFEGKLTPKGTLLTEFKAQNRQKFTSKDFARLGISIY